MFKVAFSLFLVFLTVDSKFYETDIGPYGHGGQYSTYRTQEYDPENGYPYGLSYKKYPDIPFKEVGVAREIEYEEPISGPIGLPYGHGGGLEGHGGGLEHVRQLGYNGYYGVGGGSGYGGYPVRYGKSLGYGYGQGRGLSYHPIYTHGISPITPHGRLDFYNHQSPYGVSQIDKGIYSDGKQNVIGEQYNRVQGHNGESLNHGDVGFNKGEVAYKDIKGDSVHFVDADGINRGQHDGKSYSGGEHFNAEGKHGNEQVLNANHNKGHNIKGFKKSHHLDETGKTEEFFDEDHDAGGKYAFNGRFGKFGELGGNSYKGGFNDGRFKTGEATKQGHYDNQYLVDKAQGGVGKFGENKYAQNGEEYGLNKGFGEHGLTGHHENSNIYKNYPVGYGGQGGYGGYGGYGGHGGYYKK